MKKWIFLIPVIVFANQTSNEELINSIEKASPRQIKKLIADGADINAINHTTSYSALMIALIEGNTVAADFLIKCGADVDYSASDGLTPLLAAAKYGHTKTMTLILEKTTNKYYQDNIGSALHYAAANGFLPIIKQLVNESTINIRSSNGSTPLIYASYNGHLSVISYLFKNFTMDTSVTNNNEDSALTIALKRGHSKIVKKLLQQGSPLTKNQRGETSLMIASAFGNHDNILDLLAQGCDLEEKDQDQNT
ncbi:MAG: ankyrin repeat domain-containing protein, partial [Brevinema sp.]